MSFSNSFPEDIIASAKHIKLLALDVDGVSLTINEVDVN